MSSLDLEICGAAVALEWDLRDLKQQPTLRSVADSLTITNVSIPMVHGAISGR